MKNYKKSQSTLEYAVVTVCVVAALLAIQVYIKRGIQGRLRSNTDSIGEQYAPGNTTSNIIVNFNSNADTWTFTDEWSHPPYFVGKVYTSVDTDANESSSRSGNEIVGQLERTLSPQISAPSSTTTTATARRRTRRGSY
jgi:hypothetical protein